MGAATLFLQRNVTWHWGQAEVGRHLHRDFLAQTHPRLRARGHCALIYAFAIEIEIEVKAGRHLTAYKRKTSIKEMQTPVQSGPLLNLGYL